MWRDSFNRLFKRSKKGEQRFRVILYLFCVFNVSLMSLRLLSIVCKVLFITIIHLIISVCLCRTSAVKTAGQCGAADRGADTDASAAEWRRVSTSKRSELRTAEPLFISMGRDRPLIPLLQRIVGRRRGQLEGCGATKSSAMPNFMQMNASNTGRLANSRSTVYKAGMT